jgi:hypothetical protein
MWMDIVYEIWSKSKGDWAGLPLLNRQTGTWEEYMEPLAPGASSSLLRWVATQGIDYYFTPLRFTKAKRSNDTVGKPGVLFADLDRGRLCPEIIPTVAWYTSDGSRQAVWYLDKPTDSYPEWASVNKALTYYSDADRGGWMGSKVLRIPGSMNYKYDPPQPGTLICHDPSRAYSLAEVGELVGAKPILESKSKEGLPEWEDVRWEDLPYGVWFWANMSDSEFSKMGRKIDRSVTIWGLLKDLKRAGITMEQAFWILRDSPVNKWRNNYQAWWQQVQKAYSKD